MATHNSLAYKAEVRRMIDRKWSSCLTPSEYKVVLFIYTHTIEWGKIHDRLKVCHFIHGIGPVCGTGIQSDKTVRSCINDLVYRGTLLEQRAQYGKILTLNLKWEPIPKMAMLPTPKKERKTPNQIGKIYLSRSVKSTAPIEKVHTLQGHTSSSLPSGHTTSTGTEKKTSTYEEIKEIVAAKQRPPKDPIGVWVSAWRETFPEQVCPAIAPKSKASGQLKKIIAGHPAPMAFLEWLVTDWRLIVGARFEWMKENPAPDYPRLGFILAFKERFVDAWNNRIRLSEELRLNSSDRLRRKLMHSGLDYTEADKEVKERSSIANARAKTAETVTKLDELLRTANARKHSRISAFENNTGIGGEPSTGSALPNKNVLKTSDISDPSDNGLRDRRGNRNCPGGHREPSKIASLVAAKSTTRGGICRPYDGGRDGIQRGGLGKRSFGGAVRPAND